LTFPGSCIWGNKRWGK